MEAVTSWSAERVSSWMRGLDVSLQQYAFEEWNLSGADLLQLSSNQLEQLGVQKIGHQELILEAVERLCSLTYGSAGESLRSITEKMRAVAHSLQMGVQGRWRVNSYDGQNTTQLPSRVLQVVVELITAARGLFLLLGRYPYSELSAHMWERKISTLCQDLGSVIHKDVTVYEKEKDIISISRQLVAICDEIITITPNSLLTHTAHLQSVDLVPVSPGEQLGIEIASTPTGHYISGTAAESPAEFSEKILAGDEVIQVNDQVVVGWSKKTLIAKLQENPNGVTLLLRRFPGSQKHREKTESAKCQIKTTGTKREEEGELEKEEGRNRYSALQKVTASLRSVSFRAAVTPPDGPGLMGQEKSEFFADQSFDGSYTAHTQVAGLEQSMLGLEMSPERRSPSPLPLDSNRARVGSCPEMGTNVEEKQIKKSATKVSKTAMSRRRVSCRELGRADCDGWLWKKRKETSVFMTQKWQRFWFVLKGTTVYWYTSQQEEKAVGLLKIGSYNIESAGEHKRKFVFRMSHPRFHCFFFAAENVSDMSKWINCLINAIQKYKKLQQNPPDNEAECYSETESEEDGSNSPHPKKKVITQKVQSSTLPRTLGRKNKAAAVTSPSPSPSAEGSKATVKDEMDELFDSLKEGGVSLIGQSQPVTHDQLRRSFIRRNKNPLINDKVHVLRALQSTLKAKEAELQTINKLLEDSEVTGVVFREWKHQNEDLHMEIEKVAAQKKQKEPTITSAETEGGGVEGLEDGACELKLSDGEELVDAELPGNRDSGRESEPEHLDEAGKAAPDNYFYI